GVGRDRPELRLLDVFEDQPWDLARAFDVPGVGPVQEPRADLVVEIVKIFEAPSRPETLPNEADSALHAAFALRVPRRACDHCKASTSVGVLRKPWIEFWRSTCETFEDDRLHVVENIGCRDATEVVERVFHAP